MVAFRADAKSAGRLFHSAVSKRREHAAFRAMLPVVCICCIFIGFGCHIIARRSSSMLRTRSSAASWG